MKLIQLAVLRAKCMYEQKKNGTFAYKYNLNFPDNASLTSSYFFLSQIISSSRPKK